jgi:hypothetical protein
MEKVKAFIERGNDGSYSVYVDLENKTLNYGIFGEGNTVKAAIEDFMSAYETMKEFHHKKNKEFVEANFEFVYDVPALLSYYSNVLSLAGLHRLTGINQAQLSQYAIGYRKPGPKTVKKIETSLHTFAKELSQVQFV